MKYKYICVLSVIGNTSNVRTHGPMSYRQKNAMSNNSPMTSSGYNYWSKTGNSASITEQASLTALGNMPIYDQSRFQRCKFADSSFLSHD